MVSIKVHFDGKALIPTKDLELAQGREYTVHIEVEQANGSQKANTAENVWERLLALAGKAEHLPEDAADNHDHYLYGTPKQ